MRLPQQVLITEVCPRDGFQNVKDPIKTEDKTAIAKALIDAGVKRLEITSFVSPRWIPQLGDAAKVVARVKGYARERGVSLIGLIPNLRGYEDAAQSGVDEITFVLSVSEAHNKSNVNKTTDQSLRQFGEIMAARAPGVRARLALATTFGCPFGEEISTARVLTLIEQGLSLGADEILLADTIGRANPLQVETVMTAILERFDADRFTLHMHDTNGQALANILTALRLGITRLEAACGGLGGCPYAPGAAGNCATEDLADMLSAMGVKTGIDQDGMRKALELIRQTVNSPIRGHMAAIWTARNKREAEE